jgi:hypothetical protein
MRKPTLQTMLACAVIGGAGSFAIAQQDTGMDLGQQQHGQQQHQQMGEQAGQQQWGQQQDDAEKREVSGTVVSLEKYLRDGREQATQATFGQDGGPKALLSDDGELYIILAAANDQMGQQRHGQQHDRWGARQGEQGQHTGQRQPGEHAGQHDHQGQTGAFGLQQDTGADREAEAGADGRIGDTGAQAGAGAELDTDRDRVSAGAGADLDTEDRQVDADAGTGIQQDRIGTTAERQARSPLQTGSPDRADRQADRDRDRDELGVGVGAQAGADRDQDQMGVGAQAELDRDDDQVFGMADTDRSAEDLSIGQQVTLVGNVYERDGVRAISVSEVRHDAAGAQQQQGIGQQGF